MPSRRMVDRASIEDRKLEIAFSLELVEWNIGRYDQIRSSVASRASLLVSANTLLLAGVALLLSIYNPNPDGEKLSFILIAFFVLLVATLIFVLTSIWYCVDAIAATRTRKTSRQTFKGVLPDRFLFNWGDTLRNNAAYEDFATKLRKSSPSEILEAALAELWTAIYQHSVKHRSLRWGIRYFRLSIILFFSLAVVTAAHRF